MFSPKCVNVFWRLHSSVICTDPVYLRAVDRSYPPCFWQMESKASSLEGKKPAERRPEHVKMQV